jgi:predicted negative regulator of RcsB-dependent stress response
MIFPVLALLVQTIQTPPAGGTSTPAPPAPPPSTGSALAGAAGLDVIWAPTLEQAQETARSLKDGRILFFFTDAGCGECDRMLKIVAPATSFFAFTRDKVPVPVDISEPAGLKLAQRMHVVGVPTWIVATPDLLECSRQEGVTTQQGWVETFIRGERGWNAFRKAQAAEAENPGDTAAVYEVARQLFQRGARGQAEGRFHRLWADPNLAPEQKEQVNAYLASIDLDAGRLDEATKRLDVLIASAKSPQLRERAELRRADIEVARGRKDLAANRLREFLKAHPESPLAAEARALLDALQGKAPESAPAAAAPASKEK